MQASNNAAIAKIYDEDDVEETECDPTKVGALTSLARVSLPSVPPCEPSEVLQAFRDWTDAASRTQKTESGIQLRRAPAIPAPPKPEFRKLELLRAEITHTTTSLTPVPISGPPPTFELLALAARRTPPPPKGTLPRPELPSAILRRSQLELPLIYDDEEEDDWLPTLKYRGREREIATALEEAQAAEREREHEQERESQLPPPPASRSFTLLPPPPRQRARTSSATQSGVVAVAPPAGPRRTESGVQAIPTSLVQSLLTREIKKASTRSGEVRIVFGPARPPTPLQITPQKVELVVVAEPSPEPAAPPPAARAPAIPPARSTVATAAPPSLRLVPAKVRVLNPAPAPRPAPPLTAAVCEIVPVPVPTVAPAKAALRVERDPFASRSRSSAPPAALTPDEAKSHLRFVLGVMFLFVCVAALLWLGAPFWRSFLAPLL